MADEKEAQKEVMEDIFPEYSFGTADAEIVSNCALQIPLAVIMMLAFLFCRRRAPWVYFPNVRNTPSHPAYSAGDGIFSWVKPVFTVEDTKLLSLIGLDGFMFLQTIKLLYRICCILSVCIVPWTCYWFYISKSDNDGLFARLSVHSIRDYRIFTVLVIIVYFITLMIYYFIFIYYKRYVTLRQLYLSSPATMTSVAKLKQISRNIPTDTTAIDYINIKSRTIMLFRLPAALRTDKETTRYIQRLGLGDVENASLIRDTTELRDLYELRDTAAQNIEKEADAIFLKMVQHYKTDNALARCSFGRDEEDLVEAAKSYDDRKFGIDEKVSFVNQFFEKSEKFMETVGRKSSLKFYLASFKELTEKIDREKIRLQNEYGSNDDSDEGGPGSLRNPEVLANSKKDVIIPVDQSLFLRTDISKDVSFFSMKQIFSFRKNRKLFTLDLPIGKKKAFVTFKDAKTTCVVMQSRIGSKVFSCDAEQAPSPNDVIWRNITKNEAFCYIAKVISSLFFISMYLLFYFLVFKITTLFSAKTNPQNWLVKILRKHHLIFTVYSGVLVPLVYNVILFFVPIIMTTLLNMQGISAYSLFQVELMNTFSLFLFFNGFLSTFCGKVLIDAIPRIYNQEETLREVISTLGLSIIRSSIFFFNTILQRLFIGTAMVFLKPAPFIFNFFITPFIRKNRRQLKELEFAPPIDLGNAIPNILLIFPMVVAYSCISPIVIVLGWIFYLANYFAYKNELLYAANNEFESGGIFWKYSARFIIYSVSILHFATAAKIYVAGYGGIAIGLLPLFFVTYLYLNGLKEMFERSCEYMPLSSVEEDYVDEFGDKAVKDRLTLLENWKENVEEEDDDHLPITELHKEKAVPFKNLSLYCDPAMSTSIATLIFPKGFYSVINYINDCDKDNFFKMK
ncbi:calcium permeable stress-gated cation channel [Pancytospora epiphaga]|nr:calcium permeable stress-gated cation channel [Pancytospora epiphaga]